jgi:hypothetical protein
VTYISNNNQINYDMDSIENPGKPANHADMQRILPVIGQNSNIACLVLGTGTNGYHENFSNLRRRKMERMAMRLFHFGVLLGISALLCGCGGVETCEELAFYEYAEPGKRVESPDDLDGLSVARELIIPEASPRPPRDLAAGCLDQPPSLRIDSEEEDS